MFTRPGWLLSLSAYLLALSILLGAVATHALRQKLSLPMMHTFEVGVQYHQLQSLGLLLLGLFLYFRPVAWSRFKIPTILHLSGLILFSGCCYCYALTEMKFFVILVPLGGITMIATWLWCAFIWGQESGSTH